MNKKLIASLSAVIMASSFFTVTAATKAPVKHVMMQKVKKEVVKSAEVQALEAQINTNSQAAQDLINKVLQSDDYKQLLIKNIELQKSIVDQQLKEGNISANSATAKKAQLDAQTKMINDATLQNLELENKNIQKSIRQLQSKYRKLSDLIASQDFKDLKSKLITNIKAIIDCYVTDGAMTSDQATTAKANVDKVSSNIDAGKTNIKALLQGIKGFGK